MLLMVGSALSSSSTRSSCLRASSPRSMPLLAKLSCRYFTWSKFTGSSCVVHCWNSRNAWPKRAGSRRTSMYSLVCRVRWRTSGERPSISPVSRRAACWLSLLSRISSLATFTWPSGMSRCSGRQGAAPTTRVAAPLPSQRSRLINWKVGSSPARRTNWPTPPKDLIGWIRRHSNWSPSACHWACSRRGWNVRATDGRLTNRLSRATYCRRTMGRLQGMTAFQGNIGAPGENLRASDVMRFTEPRRPTPGAARAALSARQRAGAFSGRIRARFIARIPFMTDRLTLLRPDDWHIHLRDGAALAQTVADAARTFGRAIVMPNLVPPVRNAQEADAYRQRILAARPAGSRFEPLMALYLTDNTSADDIRQARASGFVHAAKLYPAGATTNSDSGVTRIDAIFPALEAMAEVGLPLLVHGEVTHSDIDVFDREKA